LKKNWSTHILYVMLTKPQIDVEMLYSRKYDFYIILFNKVQSTVFHMLIKQKSLACDLFSDFLCFRSTLQCWIFYL
jgi:hypothetical protein